MLHVLLFAFLLLEYIITFVFSKVSTPPTIHSHAKRIDPAIHANFRIGDANTPQIQDAFTDAIQLASYAMDTDLLGDITVTQSDPDQDCPGEWGIPSLVLSLERYDTATPRLRLCPVAVQYPGISEVHCAALGDTVSWRMMTLGPYYTWHWGPYHCIYDTRAAPGIGAAIRLSSILPVLSH